MIDVAVKLDNRLYERRMEKKNKIGWGNFKGRNNHHRANQGQKRHDPYGPMPMDLDATAEQKGQSKKPRDKSNVECYNCHRKGHYARECRSPKQERQIKATRDDGFNEEDQTNYAEWDHEYGISDYRDIYDEQDTESEDQERIRTQKQMQQIRDEHPDWFREPGDEQRVASKPKTEEEINDAIYEDLESQFQDA